MTDATTSDPKPLLCPYCGDAIHAVITGAGDDDWAEVECFTCRAEWSSHGEPIKAPAPGRKAPST